MLKTPAMFFNSLNAIKKSNQPPDGTVLFSDLMSMWIQSGGLHLQCLLRNSNLSRLPLSGILQVSDHFNKDRCADQFLLTMYTGDIMYLITYRYSLSSLSKDHFIKERSIF